MECECEDGWLKDSVGACRCPPNPESCAGEDGRRQRLELAISLLRQLSTFPERFGVAPLRELPPSLDVVVTLRSDSVAADRLVVRDATALCGVPDDCCEAKRELDTQVHMPQPPPTRTQRAP